LRGDETPEQRASAIRGVLDQSLTQSGKSIFELSGSSPVLLVFLRHAGCSFCREALADLGRARAEIEGGGVRIVLAHMGDAAALEALLPRFGLSGVDRICDPGRDLYAAFGIRRGTTGQLFGPKVLWRGLFRGVLARYGIGSARADSSQMPAIFLVDQSEIVRRFRHRSAADRPDYVSFCSPDGSRSTERPAG
jgi:peroxiredoxin